MTYNYVIDEAYLNQKNLYDESFPEEEKFSFWIDECSKENNSDLKENYKTLFYEIY